jgi:hypothetical protein
LAGNLDACRWAAQRFGGITGEPAYLDIGPIAGEPLLAALLAAIGDCAPEIRRATVITNGDRPLAVLVPPEPWETKEARCC